MSSAVDLMKEQGYLSGAEAPYTFDSQLSAPTDAAQAPAKPKGKVKK